jgi:hypothetical protein
MHGVRSPSRSSLQDGEAEQQHSHEAEVAASSANDGANQPPHQPSGAENTPPAPAASWIAAVAKAPVAPSAVAAPAAPAAAAATAAAPAATSGAAAKAAPAPAAVPTARGVSPSAKSGARVKRDAPVSGAARPAGAAVSAAPAAPQQPTTDAPAPAKPTTDAPAPAPAKTNEPRPKRGWEKPEVTRQVAADVEQLVHEMVGDSVNTSERKAGEDSAGHAGSSRSADKAEAEQQQHTEAAASTAAPAPAAVAAPAWGAKKMSFAEVIKVAPEVPVATSIAARVPPKPASASTGATRPKDDLARAPRDGPRMVTVPPPVREGSGAFAKNRDSAGNSAAPSLQSAASPDDEGLEGNWRNANRHKPTNAPPSLRK